VRRPFLTRAVAAAAAAASLAACSSSQAASGHEATSPSRAPAVTATPTPTGVSAHAKVTASCVTGIYDQTQNEFYTMAGLANGSDISTGDVLAEAYQLTLSDTSSAAAQVTGFTVAFYSAGRELTSNSETLAAPRTVGSGESVTWTEYPWGSSMSGHGASVGPFASGQDGAVNTGATCRLTQWRRA
jgi:hypothetical protein